jgi:LysM repeat protein
MRHDQIVSPSSIRKPGSQAPDPQGSAWRAYPGKPTCQASRFDLSRVALRLVLLGWLLFLGLLFLIVLALAGSGWLRASGRIGPGLWVGDIYLGGLTINQAAAVLERAWDADRPLQLSDGVRTWSMPASQLGMRLDAPATAARALAAGHGETAFDTLSLTVQGMFSGRQVEPGFWLEPAAALAGIESLRSLADIPPIDATLRVKDSDLVVTPAVHGYIVDVERTLAYLAEDPAGVMEGGITPLFMHQVAPQVGDVSVALGEAKRLLETSVRLVAYDPVSDEELNWEMTQEELLSWLVIADGSDGPQVWLDEGKITAHLQNLTGSLGSERWLELSGGPYLEKITMGENLRATVRHTPSTYTVKAGDTLLKIAWQTGMPYWRILEENLGLDERALWPGQTLTIPSKDVLLPLQVVPGKRIVISISQQRMWVYENGNLLSENIISTGMDRSPTQPGIFQVQTHDLSAYASIWDLTMPHWLGIYEAWPGFMNGIHGLPTLSNGQRLWAGNLGRPASYGCIILDLPAAERLYHWAEAGVVVEIQP